jgi:hypothetical protein
MAEREWIVMKCIGRFLLNNSPLSIAIAIPIKKTIQLGRFSQQIDDQMCDPDTLGSIRLPTKKREKDLPTKQGQACLKHAHPQVIQNLVSIERHSAKRAKV